MSNTDIAKSVVYAQQAKNISSSAYPGDSDKQDAYRHFSWNFIMADNWDSLKARTFANNHEWGLVLLTPTLNHYDSQYNNYKNQGYADKYSAETAFIDAWNSGNLITSYNFVTNTHYNNVWHGTGIRIK